MKNITDLPEFSIDIADIDTVAIAFIDGNTRRIGAGRISLLIWNPSSEPPKHQGNCIVVMNGGAVVVAQYGGRFNGHQDWGIPDDPAGEESFTEKDFICWAELPYAPLFAAPIIQRLIQQGAENESFTSSEL